MALVSFLPAKQRRESQCRYSVSQSWRTHRRLHLEQALGMPASKSPGFSEHVKAGVVVVGSSSVH